MKNTLTLILIGLSSYIAQAQASYMDIWPVSNFDLSSIDSITFTSPPPSMVIHFPYGCFCSPDTIPLSSIDSITYQIAPTVVSNPGAGVTFNSYTYSSTVLGNGQEWMAENLRTTKYANGDTIPNVDTISNWLSLSTGAWCYYNNDSNYETPYGKLYNWYAVTDSRNVCPTGWHVPNDVDWRNLIVYLDPYFTTPIAGGVQSSVAGGKLKSTGTQYWLSPNTNATNVTGFSGLPAGGLGASNVFGGLGTWGDWWSTSPATYHSVTNSDGSEYLSNGVGLYLSNSTWGESVRCIKN